MKIIKYIFFLLLLSIIGGAVYIATKDGQFEVEESKIIDAPDELLFHTINEFKTWEKWNPYPGRDSDMEIVYAEKTSGKGASYDWKSEAQGEGSLKTIKSIPFSRIDQEYLNKTSSGENIRNAHWELEKLENKKTKVTITISGELSFMEKVLWELKDDTIEERISPEYIRRLTALDAFVNQEMEKYTVSVSGKTEHGGGFYMYSATASSMESIAQKTTEMFPLVLGYVKKNNLPQTGMSFVLYNEFNRELGTAIYSTAIPVRDRVITPSESNVLCDFMPRQKVVKILLKGNHKHLKEAWDAGYKFMDENALQIDEKGSPFEIYQTDPHLQPNPATWITEVYIPYKDTQGEL